MAVGDETGTYVLRLKSRFWRDAPRRRSLLIERSDRRSALFSGLEPLAGHFLAFFAPWREERFWVCFLSLDLLWWPREKGIVNEIFGP